MSRYQVHALFWQIICQRQLLLKFVIHGSILLLSESPLYPAYFAWLVSSGLHPMWVMAIKMLTRNCYYVSWRYLFVRLEVVCVSNYFDCFSVKSDHGMLKSTCSCLFVRTHLGPRENFHDWRSHQIQIYLSDIWINWLFFLMRARPCWHVKSTSSSNDRKMLFSRCFLIITIY